jgi:peroxiredoxin
MIRFSAILLAVSLLLAPGISSAEEKQESILGRQIEPFELLDHRGKAHRLDDSKDSPVVVVVFLGTECPLAQQYGPRLQQLAERFAEKKVSFFAINSNQQDSLSKIAAYVKAQGLKIPFLKDPGNRVADQFQAQRTPEAFVLDRQRQIAYRGRIDDQFTYGRQKPKVEHQYVAEAVEALLAGKKVEIAETEAHGCHIGRVLTPNEKSAVTYSEHIAPIFQERCVSCHRPGEIGPFALRDYDEVVGWAEMIREVVSDERMPPWHASPDHGKFANDWRLSDREKQLINHWVEAGAPQGDPAKLPPPREYVEGWQIGEPDAVFYIADKPFQVPAQGEVRYQYFTVDPGFTDDKWIQAAECRPDKRSVVHHIIVGLIPPGGGRKTAGGLHSEWLTATAPGARPLVLREGYAKLIPAGSKLVFQMHYTPNGTAQEDRSCVGFKFADPATVRKQVATEKAATTSFAIPPYAENHRVEARHRFDRDTELLALFPHMHLRGKSFRYTLIYPDKSREILLDVPRYDFNWQNGYELAEPKLIPAGSQMFCEAAFDNSKHNLANPDPNATVRWGDQTWEEMMIGYFDMALADQDLTKSRQRRTEAFLMQARAGNVTLSDELRSLAKDSLGSREKLEAFGVELRRTVPQLDRICWTTVADGKVTIRQVAQEQASAQAVPNGNAGREVDARVSRLSSLAGESKPQVFASLGDARGIDLRYMAGAFGSSLHVPRSIEGHEGTINFWSSEADAFGPEAVELLSELAALMGN